MRRQWIELVLIFWLVACGQSGAREPLAAAPGTPGAASATGSATMVAPIPPVLPTVQEGDRGVSSNDPLPPTSPNATPLIELRGQVTNREGRPMADLPIRLAIRTPGIPLDAIGIRTQATGEFQTSLRPAEYELIIAAPGYITETRQLNIAPPGPVVVDVVLDKMP